MGFLDKALDKGKAALGKAEQLAGEHADQVKGALDKVEDAANKATKNKYKSQIAGAGDKASDFVDGLEKKDGKPVPVQEETPPPAQ
ncbi:MAG: hypothetical protein JWO12_134 [Frankiales bacterium]|jgi:hypothetical protein|nr:hypothetical protein [Frankiales bacterium]